MSSLNTRPNSTQTVPFLKLFPLRQLRVPNENRNKSPTMEKQALDVASQDVVLESELSPHEIRKRTSDEAVLEIHTNPVTTEANNRKRCKISEASSTAAIEVVDLDSDDSVEFISVIQHQIELKEDLKELLDEIKTQICPQRNAPEASSGAPEKVSIVSEDCDPVVCQSGNGMAGNENTSCRVTRNTLDPSTSVVQQLGRAPIVLIEKKKYKQQYKTPYRSQRTAGRSRLIFGSPLDRFRPGSFLNVTDLSEQLWCEKQLEFKLDPPHEYIKLLRAQEEALIKELREAETEEEQAEIQEEILDLHVPRVVRAGTAIHAEQENKLIRKENRIFLETHSAEDSVALKAIHLLLVVEGLMGQTNEWAEVPVFGLPMESKVAIHGRMDKLHYDSANRHLTVIEFKTRNSFQSPGSAQARTHKLQILLYMEMLSDLMQSMFRLDSFLKSAGLRGDERLAPSLTDFVSQELNLEPPVTLNDILDRLLTKMKDLKGVRISAEIQYIYQKTKQPIETVKETYGEEQKTWLKDQLVRCLDYWQGGRFACGVDRDDAWKCHSCVYQIWCKAKPELF